MEIIARIYTAPEKKNIRYPFCMMPAILFLFAVVLTACEQGPRDIRMGEQECAHCRMMISDERFAAQLVTEQGRQYAFDAVECLAAYVKDGDGQDLDIAGKWVPDFNRVGEWLVAGEAIYLQSDELRSPMALNFSAYAGRRDAQERQDEFGGDVLDWQELKQIVHREWSGGQYQH